MNNSELLYLYDAKLANPNGDPDEENRPRMDDETNLVTDLRLKRYIRDYLLENGQELYVQKIDGQPVTAENRINRLNVDNKEDVSGEILEHFIDVRLFGATVPLKKNNLQFTGPVQFNWGYSLNNVDVLEASITSNFASSEGNRMGAIGKDYRVRYSFLAFSGVLSGKRAEKTELKEEDVRLMDQALRYAIPQQATRSKIGQYPRMYMRVEYKDDQTVLGDMRNYIKLNKEADLDSIFDAELEVGELITYLKSYSSRIEKIHYFCDTQLTLCEKGIKKSFEELFDCFALEEVR